MYVALACRHVVASTQEVTSWSYGADHSPELSISRVVDALRDEFPAVSLSKVRYLENGDFVSPARIGSGYCKYSAVGVERLRYVLTEQRDSFTPLNVIHGQSDAFDAGHELMRRRIVQAMSSEGQTMSLGGRRAIPAADLSDLTSADMDTLEYCAKLGLATPDLAGYSPVHCVQTVSTIARLESTGVDVRVLRAVCQGAEHGVGIIDRTVSPQRGRGRGADREHVRIRVIKLGDLFTELHWDMLAMAVSLLAEDGD